MDEIHAVGVIRKSHDTFSFLPLERLFEEYRIRKAQPLFLLMRFSRTRCWEAEPETNLQSHTHQCRQWLTHVNTERESDATRELPATLLVEEQRKFSPLPASAADYGFFECVVAS